MKISQGMKSWLARKKNSSFTHKIALVAGSVASAQFIQIIFTPLLTRLYQPVDFGLFGIYTSVVSIVMMVASFSYEQAILLPDDEGQAAGIAILALRILLMITSLAALVVFFFDELLVRFPGMQDLEPYFWILPIGIFACGFFRILNFWAVRKEAYSAIANTNIVTSLSRAVFQTGLGLTVSSPLGLMLGDELGQLGGLAPLLRTASRDKKLAEHIKLQDMMKLLVRYRQFPLIISWSVILNTLAQQLPVVLLAVYYAPQIVGFFALSERVLRSLVRTLGMAVAQVYMGVGSRLLRDDPLALQGLFDKLSKRLLLAGLGPFAFLAIMSPWVFAWVFGEQWRQAGIYTQILSPMLLGQFVVYPLSQSAILVEKQSVQLIADLMRTSMVVLVFLLAAAMDWRPLFTIGVYSISSFVVHLVYYFIYRNVIWKRSRELSSLKGSPSEASSEAGKLS